MTSAGETIGMYSETKNTELTIVSEDDYLSLCAGGAEVASARPLEVEEGKWLVEIDGRFSEEIRTFYVTNKAEAYDALIDIGYLILAIKKGLL